MTIQRQYTLPHCNLMLEGMSSEVTGLQEGRPLMSILTQMECRFTGFDTALQGGQDLFESLLRTVNSYAQECLSGISHPQVHNGNSERVTLEKIKEKNLHRLTWQTSEVKENLEIQMPNELYLTTVQLFDLVEAVDQFYGDSRTLPELQLTLEPVSRRYRQADQPIVERAAPPVLGITSLALATILFGLIPAPPEIPQPERLIESSETTEETTSEDEIEEEETASEGGTEDDNLLEETPLTETESASRSPLISVEELEAILATAPDVTSPTELSYMQRYLQRQLNKTWNNRDQVTEPLEYKVSLGQDGSILDYESVNETSLGKDEQTPLPQLRYLPTQEELESQEAIALFRVVFTDRGTLEVSPWKGLTGTPGFGPEITDSGTLVALLPEIKQNLLDTRSEFVSFDGDLEYRIAVTEEGVLADYEPQNAAAVDFLNETPLLELLQPEAAGIGVGENATLVPQEPLAHYKVVFKPSGVIEMSPWRGF